VEYEIEEFLEEGDQVLTKYEIAKIDNNIVTTNKGAQCTLEEARAALIKLKAGLLRKGDKIGNYTFLKLFDFEGKQFAKVGCHKFLVSELEDNFKELDQENAFDSLQGLLEDNQAFDIEIIYYSNAIDYLQNNDPSLRESLSIANEMGYETKNLNSEILASLLASQNSREEFSELESQIDAFFEELNAEEEEEEETETK